MNKMEALITFDKSVEAIAADDIINKNGIKGRIVSIPEQLEASCGFSLRVKVDDLDRVWGALSASHVNYKNTFKILSLSLIHI